MLIQNYGLFWKMDDAVREESGAGGARQLQGRLSTDANFVADFCDQQAVYVLYDRNYKVVYVGRALGERLGSRFLYRLNDHRRDHLAERWEKFSWFGFRWALSDGGLSRPNISLQTTPQEAISHLEAVLISAAEPPLNRRGGDFGRAQQYLQVAMSEVE